jgi:hypothetical protein
LSYISFWFTGNLLLKKDGNKNLDIKATQEVVGLAHYNAYAAWMTTNSDYTEAEINIAQLNGVRLINRNQLIEIISNMNPEAFPNLHKVGQRLIVIRSFASNSEMKWYNERVKRSV